jgi:hypothetical protein
MVQTFLRFGICLLLALTAVRGIAQNQAQKIYVATQNYTKLARGSAFDFSFYLPNNKPFLDDSNQRIYFLSSLDDVQNQIKRGKSINDTADLKALSGIKNLVVVIYPNLRTTIPENQTEREKLAGFYTGLTVVFDDEEQLVFEVRNDGFLTQALLNGVYFVRNRKIAMRYPIHSLGALSSQGILDEVMAQTKRFEQNQPFDHVPYEVGRTGAVIPSNVIKPSPATVLFRVTLKKGEVKTGSSENAINQNRLLENLPTLLGNAKMRYVGVVFFDKTLLPELEKAYPKWDFISMTTGAERLVWYELNTAVLNSKNIVVGNYGLFYNTSLDNFGIFRDAVQEALQ